ncbi:ABC transporter permease [Clostridium grantii]|uniref:Carbohydrate ABC transporter membrane protein 1, CUT1 family (TC 3.A.1.1.-) n=1 Tax=Clostridium grantii DSM 8605 TaxID=1121316 RepID=A0A1M5WM31_9CLOT|nr:ABC transporter permease subunit [Clostridium grantii]SHH88576.1 carbohydrate ABC transporter membrane protein 1, CUT1 family (TC 3.A.1.1.-) [Clostridium grantii DSM 8605]
MKDTIFMRKIKAKNEKVMIKFNESWTQVKKDKALYVLLAPMIIWLILFKYKPLYGLQIAFKDYNIFKGIEASKWVGFEHFITFFNGPYFLRTFGNTVILNGVMLLVSFPIPIILALLINEIRIMRFKKFIQTSIYLPHFISSVIIAGIVVNFLSPSTGIINILMEKIGLDRVYFLIKPEYFRGVFVSMNVWQDAGFNSIVFLAALSAIDPQLYEAVKIDGGNKFKQMIHVTLPGILPTIMIMLIIAIGNLLNLSFEKIILLYNPSTFETADVLSTFVYRTGLVNAQYDLAAAVGLFEALIAFVLVYGANRLSKKFTQNSLW